nr:hypothetical protein [Lachnospiraceae bacterium]
IIQDKTRLDNLRKVQEMRHYFTDEDGAYRKELKNRDDMVLFKYLSWVVLGILGAISLTISWKEQWNALGLFQWLALGLLLAESVALQLFYHYKMWRSDHSEAMTRYSEKDIFIYWLLVDSRIPRVIVAKNRRTKQMECVVIRPKLFGKANLSAFEFKGNGFEVESVDLDDNVITLGEYKGDLDIGDI